MRQLNISTVKTSSSTSDVKHIPTEETLRRLISPQQQQQQQQQPTTTGFVDCEDIVVSTVDDMVNAQVSADEIILSNNNHNNGAIMESGECASPRSSRSSSLNSTTDTTTTKAPPPQISRHGSSGSATGPGYARNLLKKKLLIPEISFDHYSSSVDEVRIDDEARSRILDYKSDIEQRGALDGGRVRKYSFNDKIRHLVDVSGSTNKERAADVVKKFIKSPSLLRKTPSFNRATATDSCVSSCPENEEMLASVEKRKKRKISTGKRTRKTSKGQQCQHEDAFAKTTTTTTTDKHKKDGNKKVSQALQTRQQQQQQQQQQQPQKSTKFRRRKLVRMKSQSSASQTENKTNNNNETKMKSKMILIYSGGDSPIKSGDSSPTNQKLVDSPPPSIKSTNSLPSSANQNLDQSPPPPVKNALPSVKINQKNRLEKLKRDSTGTATEDSLESSASEYDGYSSALSDIESPTATTLYGSGGITKFPLNRMRSGIAKRVWKSINTLLFENNNDAELLLRNNVLSASPLSRLRHDAVKAAAACKHRNSMPSGLDHVQDNESGTGNRHGVCRKPMFLLKNYDGVINNTQDDMTLFGECKTQNGSVDFSAKFHGGFMCSPKDGGDEFSLSSSSSSHHKRSKSLDFLLDHTMIQQSVDATAINGGDSVPDNLFTEKRRKKAHSTLTAREHDRELAKTSLRHNQHQRNQQYKVVVAHAPKPPTLPLQELSIPKSATFDTGATATSKTKKKTGHNTSASALRRKYHIMARLQDMKGSSQQELKSFLSDKQFQPGKVKDWCRVLSESVKSRVVHITGDAYKVVVQVFIGALCEDGIHAAIQCNKTEAVNGSSSISKDDDGDDDQGLFTVTYKGKDLFAMVSVLTFELMAVLR